VQRRRRGRIHDQKQASRRAVRAPILRQLQSKLSTESMPQNVDRDVIQSPETGPPGDRFRLDSPPNFATGSTPPRQFRSDSILGFVSVVTPERPMVRTLRSESDQAAEGIRSRPVDPTPKIG
jgi:hypothetical protein